MPTTAEIVRSMYDAWNRGNLEQATAPLAEDCEHVIHIPQAVNALGGRTAGRTATLERLGAIARDFEILACEPGPILVQGDRAATQVHMRYRHRVSGEMMEVTAAHFWTLDDAGRVVRFEEYHDVPAVESFSRRAGMI